MRFGSLAALATLSCLCVIPSNVSALTMDQVASICASHQGDCSEVPLLQAYVGGALDLIAMLDEETHYLSKVYCKPPSTLFDVPAIIKFMGMHRVEYANKNAMMLVIRYLEEKGGC